LLGFPGASQAHFILTSPPAMYEQDGLGDPQKAPPCGDQGMAVATGEVTSYQAGDTITVTIEETIFHPGHYRIALAVDGAFPEEPPVTPGPTDCGSAPIDPAPAFPVLADGVWVHTDPMPGPQSIDITVPDGVSCDNCTLQVIQFMSNHGLNDPGGCYYHHCATVSVGPSAGTAGETGTPTDESGGDSTGGGPVTTAADDPGGSGDATGAGEDSGSTGGGQGTSLGTVTEGNTAEAPADDEGGCSCSTPAGGAKGGLGMLLGLLGLAGLRHGRRRRRES
jgi:MYXO-CTERM domain-containing protein